MLLHERPFPTLQPRRGRAAPAANPKLLAASLPLKYPAHMNKADRNIETIARALCARHLQDMAIVATDTAAGVDRYWPLLAAEMEAGLIDTAGNRLVPFDYDASQAAYRNWVQRHP